MSEYFDVDEMGKGLFFGFIGFSIIAIILLIIYLFYNHYSYDTKAYSLEKTNHITVPFTKNCKMSEDDDFWIVTCHLNE